MLTNLEAAQFLSEITAEPVCWYRDCGKKGTSELVIRRDSGTKRYKLCEKHGSWLETELLV